MRKVSMKKKDKKNGNAEEEVNSAGEEIEETEENGDADPLEDPLTKEDQDEDNVKEKKEKKESETKKKSKKGKKSKAEKEAKVDDKDEVEEENNAEEEDDNEEEEEYEVENIVGHKTVKGKLLYQIRWKGYSKDSDTWEPEDTLSCPDIILKYNEKNKVSKGKKRPSSSKKTTPAKKSKSTKEVSTDPEKEWEVDRIIDVHSKKKGGREFLIRWKGYGASADSWEPEDNVNSPDLIEKFLQKLGDVQGSTQKELRTAPKHTKHFTLAMDQSGRRLSRRNNNRQRAVYYDAE